MQNSLFKSGIAYLQKILGKNIDADLMHAYWTRLEKMTDEQFKTALSRLSDTFIPTSQVPFPLIAHFLQATGASESKTPRQMALIAIEAVRKAAERPGAYKTVSFGDRALHSVLNRFGGWPIIARWSDDDWGYNTRAFCETYEAEYGSKTGPDRLPGLNEIANTPSAMSDEARIIANKHSKPILIDWAGNKGELSAIENKDQKLQCEQLINNLAEKMGA